MAVKKETGCEICEFNRYIEKCHIIPKQYGGWDGRDNVLILCPNHHKLLDAGMLNIEEIAFIEDKIEALLQSPKVKNNYRYKEYLGWILGITEKPHWLNERKNFKEEELKLYRQVLKA